MMTSTHLLGAWPPAVRWIAGVAAALLAACGGHDDPMARYLEQPLEWHACAAERFNALDLKLAQRLGARVSCAEIRVPMDYAQPELAEIQVALLRVRAGSPAEDTPALLINPGGPGVEGLFQPLQLAVYWGMDGTSDDPSVVRSYQQMAQRYDLIGFSPRGMGWSTRLECATPQPPLPVADPTRHLDKANIDKTLVNSELIARACEGNPLTPHIHTEATARDMDLIRQVLHQDKLHYIGLSYGTWLGHWYAGLFPERVGRMLLSGVTDFGVPLNHQSLPQDQGRQVVLDQVLLPYAARHPERFGLPTTVAALRQLIDALPDALHAAFVNTLIEGNLLSNANLADGAVVTLRAAQVLHGELQARPGVDRDSLMKWAADFDFVPATAEASLHDMARMAAQDLVGRTFKPEGRKEHMYWSVVCNDSGTGFTPETWVAQSNLNARLYPDFGGAVRENACLFWPLKPRTRPAPQRATETGPILMLQATLDPLTVLSGALNSLYALPNAGMVLIEGEITHAPLPPYGTRCVDEPIAAYFLAGTPPPRTTLCGARPLAADAGG